MGCGRRCPPTRLRRRDRRAGDHTPAGRRYFDEVRAGIAAITDRLYAGLPAEDLEVAARVLLAVTDRAKAELDG